MSFSGYIAAAMVVGRVSTIPVFLFFPLPCLSSASNSLYKTHMLALAE